MYISKVEITNYKGFKNTEIELKDGLNVIIGHNNGGKSTLLEAISLVIDSERSKRLSAWDFHQGISLSELKESAPTIKISLYFSMSDGEDLNSKDVALLSSYAVSLSPQIISCLTYEFFLPNTEMQVYKGQVSNAISVFEIMKIIDSFFIRKYTYAIYGGKPSLHQTAAYEDLHKIDYQKVDALRNVESELFSGRADLLHSVLSYFLDFNIKNSDLSKEEKAASLKEKRELFQTDTKANIKSLIERIEGGKNEILKYADQTGALYQENDINFDGSIKEEDLLRVLNLLVLSSNGFNVPIFNNGLGYNNLIYISLLLAKMQSNKEVSYMGTTNAKALSLLSIEEPEAHLHPELQYHFLGFLRKNIEDGKVKQVFVTTHSPSLTAKVKLDELCCLFKDQNHNTRAYYPRNIYRESEKSKKYVQRYLDATRADMFFAGRIIFVEGLAEQILIPVFVKLLGFEQDWLKKQAIIINIGGRYFNHFLKMYDNNNNDTFPIKVACITDRDPVKKKKTSTEDESYSSCWPIEYNASPTEYDYKNHSEKFVNDYNSHPNIRFFSPDEKGKTLEYEIARVNEHNPIILTDSISNKKELEGMITADTFEQLIKICKSNKLIELYSGDTRWNETDKIKGMIASRYQDSLKKGENALELANSLNLLTNEDAIKFNVPTYIIEAIKWILEKK